jgi:hypothetical protein
MYAKGMTTRDITAHLKEIYGVDASAEMISRMTVIARRFCPCLAPDICQKLLTCFAA